jgi:hypothetical protein
LELGHNIHEELCARPPMSIPVGAPLMRATGSMTRRGAGNVDLHREKARGGRRCDAASLREFGDPYSPAEWADLRPAVVVRPASTEEVQAVVRIAGQRREALFA